MSFIIWAVVLAVGGYGWRCIKDGKYLRGIVSLIICLAILTAKAASQNKYY